MDINKEGPEKTRHLESPQMLDMSGTKETSFPKIISDTANKSWSCRQFVVLVFSLGAVALAYFDPSFRPTFGNLVNLTVGGYLGQMIPRQKT